MNPQSLARAEVDNLLSCLREVVSSQLLLVYYGFFGMSTGFFEIFEKIFEKIYK